MRFESIRASHKFWLTGIALAVAGVVLARLVAPLLDGRAESLIALTGQLTALAGLGTICFGVRRRVWRAQPSDPGELNS